ncbi:MAG: hypothetical protein NUW12_12570 [Firmicutes bacterium]|jgi:hypothetical protein|nr:hypothetical protein [Bacillota bacterium]MDH7496720.1 hypothetical protein [Bacillota bacterium]
MWIKGVLLVLLVFLVVVLAAISYGTARWKADVDKLHTEMEGARSRDGAAAYDPREIADLPSPVQRYFRAVLKEGQAYVAAANIEHTGLFNMGEDEERWRPFTSSQRVVTKRPGFVWDARILMAPGLKVFVRDAYVAGRGVLTAKLLGLITVMEQPSTAQLGQGELMRFLAEAAWYPTALLPSQGVRWEAVDDTRASATLSDGSNTARLVVEFDSQGLIASVTSEARYREVRGAQVPTPWQGRFWDYRLHDGMMIPFEGEVAWLLPEGPKPYWRARIQRIEYEYAR